MKQQTIAFDLDGTLIPECGEFSCQRTEGLARLISKRSLRRDSRALLRSLISQGHDVMIYTLSQQSAGKLKAWFWAQGVPVSRVITAEEHDKRLKKASLPQTCIKVPHLFSIDLLVDDCPRNVEAARLTGTNAVLVTNRTEDWTQEIRLACRLTKRVYSKQLPATAIPAMQLASQISNG
jgi:FMN phosphatase YigB (HAD superfamily)